MSNNKQSEKEVIIDSIPMSNVYFSYAKKLSEATSIKEKLASAVIYAALAEFICEEFIKAIINIIEADTASKQVGVIAKMLNNNSNTNLESALKKLKVLSYPDKDNIEKELEIIKDARNKVFHNLVRATEKKIRLDVQISIIQDHVPHLRDLISKSLLAMI